MSKELPEHPWVLWAKFLKERKSRGLDEAQETRLTMETAYEIFGSYPPPLEAFAHQMDCEECNMAYGELLRRVFRRML